MPVIIDDATPAATLGQTRAALALRGFQYLEPAFLTDALNDAKNIFEDLFPFPWLWATATGTTPLLIEDLKVIRYVRIPGQATRLPGIRELDALDVDPDQVSGYPQYWYLSDHQTLNTFPPGSQNVEVKYVKFSPELANDADMPLFPARYNKFWRDLAIIECYKETFNFEKAELLWNDLQQRKIPKLIEYFEVRNRMNPEVQAFSTDQVSIDS